jgi:hypothetical protein
MTAAPVVPGVSLKNVVASIVKASLRELLSLLFVPQPDTLSNETSDKYHNKRQVKHFQYRIFGISQDRVAYRET